MIIIIIFFFLFFFFKATYSRLCIILGFVLGFLQTVGQFKESHERCLQCGLLLAEQDQNPVARHFGLQLIEHMVK